MSERIEMHEVSGWNDLRNAGDYYMVLKGDGSKCPVIVCPQCLRPGVCSNHTLVQEKPLTIRASYLCGQHKVWPDGTHGSCGWHGFVTDGIMESC